MKLTEFVPINYYQVEAGDPLVLDMGYVCKIEIKQLSIYNLVSINTIVNYSIKQIQTLMDGIDKSEKIEPGFLKSINKSIYTHYMILIEMIYGLTKDNFKKEKEKEEKKEQEKYHKYIIDYFIKNVENLYYVINKIFEYNSRLKKKLLDLQNMSIWQSESSMTGGEELFNYYAKKSQEQLSTIQPSLN